MAFDPDSFLKGETQKKSVSGFDPDAFLKGEDQPKDSVRKTEELAKTKEPKAGQIQGNARATGLGLAIPYTGAGGFLIDYFLKKNPEASEKLQSLVEGALNTTTAGASEALATKAGVPLNDPESPRFREPALYSTGEIGGVALPGANLGRGTTLIGRAIRSGATGAIYGGVGGASGEIIRDPKTTIEEALKSSVDDAAIGGGIGAAIPGLGAVLAKLPSADRLRQGAAKDIEKALGATTKDSKAAVEKLKPEILKRPFLETFSFTRKGLQEKTGKERELAGEAIEAFGKLEGETNPKQIVNALETLKNPYIIEGKVVDPDAISRIQGIQDVFAQYGDSISDEGLRAIRRTFDAQIRESKGFFKDIKEGTTLNIKKIAANEIRNIISEKNPDLAKLNKQFSFWANLDDVISETNKKRPPGDFTGNLTALAGAATAGNVPEAAQRAVAIKSFISAINSPGWRFTTARVKSRLADALANQDLNEISKITSTLQSMSDPIIGQLMLRQAVNQSSPSVEE